MAYLNEQDIPNADQAECYITIDGKVHLAMYAKNFEAQMDIKTKEVPILGKVIVGHKAQKATLPFKMVIYKCTETFDDIVEEFKKTGKLPTFDIQVTQNDTSTSIGRSTKIYKDCLISGKVLLSLFDAEGNFVEQTIEGYCGDYEAPEKYTNPSYMG